MGLLTALSGNGLLPFPMVRMWQLFTACTPGVHSEPLLATFVPRMNEGSEAVVDGEV